MNQNYSNITETIDEMITYFSRLFTEHDTTLQEYKAKLFEINVKLDELSRTQNVYSLNTDYRKSVFSPIALEPEENEKEKEIKNEIDNLTSNREKYEYGISEESIYLKSIDKRIKKLNKAKASLSKMMLEFGEKEEQIRIKDKVIEEDIKKESQRQEKLNSDLQNEEKLKEHLRNILMIDTYDDTYHSTVLDKRIKSVINDNNHKLDNVRGYIYSSPGRSKVLVDEITSTHKNMMLVIDDQLNRLNYNFDDKKALKEMLKEYLNAFKEKNKDIELDYHIGEIIHKPNYVRYITLNKLLNIFFDNIHKHSKATKVKFEAYEEGGELYFEIKDNGIGLPKDYLTKSDWYSGLHRAEELLFLLNGSYNITNNEGTQIEFSFKYE